MAFTNSEELGSHAGKQPEPATRVRLPRRVREQQMLEVATQVFGRLGYHGASMDQIADEAGISKPMLYAYFNSKEGLYIACLRHAGSNVIEHVRGSFDPNRNAEQHMWDSFTAFFTFIRDNRAAWQLIGRETYYDNRAFEEVSEGVRQELRDTIAEIGRVSSTETAGDPFADPERRTAMAYATLGAAEALGNWWLESDSTLQPETPCRHLMNFFWLGFHELAEGAVWTEESVGTPSSS
jgi:AcrR family transcriptional regulator